MSNFLQNLQQPEYVHVLLNHLPLTGLVATLLTLLAGLVVRNRAILFLGLGLVSLFSMSAWPVVEYGEEGFDRVLAMSDDEGGAYLKHHRDLAGKWVFLYYVTAGAGVAAMVVGWKKPNYLWAASLGVAVLCAGSLVAGSVIAEYGGMVRHREFRRGPPPSVEDHSANQQQIRMVGCVNDAGPTHDPQYRLDRRKFEATGSEEGIPDQRLVPGDPPMNAS